MQPATEYQYPGVEAQFTLYNFHSQQLIDELADVLGASGKQTPRIIQLFGEKGSGRHFLLEAAAYHCHMRGIRVTVMPVSLDGYEPDTPLKGILEYLSRQADAAEATKLREVAKRIKFEIKATPASFLFLSLGVKADCSAEEILQWLHSDPQVAGGPKSEREQLRAFLARITHERRILLHFPDGRAVDVGLRNRLMDEAVVNPKLFVAFSYLNGSAGLPGERHKLHSVHISSWNREEMERAFAERFRPARMPNGFLDFAWQFTAAEHNRQSFARVLLRTITNNCLRPDAKGAWRMERNWERNEQLLEEFDRDSYEGVLAIESQLEKSGVPEHRIQAAKQFLTVAALCDPTIPVHATLAVMGVPESERDEFIDWIDDSFGTEQEVGLWEDLGFRHPGFPAEELIYRFRNPLLPAIALKRTPDANELAVKLLNSLYPVFRPDTRAVANLYLRLYEWAGAQHETEQYGAELAWWVALEDTEALVEAISQDMEAGTISPQLIWSALNKSNRYWPPARQLAVLEAYGKQRDGIPVSNRFDYLVREATLLSELGRYKEAVASVEEARQCEFPKPAWIVEINLYNLLGAAKFHLGEFSEARANCESALAIASRHFGPKHPDVAATLNNLAGVLKAEGHYRQAREQYERALAITEQVFGPKHPEVATTLNNLAGVLKAEGHYRQAREQYERALAIREEAFGPKHPDVANTLNNLAMVLKAEGHYRQAREQYERALAIREEVFGPKHPGVATTLNNLAGVLAAEGHYRQAREQYERALAIAAETLGPEHPDVVTIRSNLALLFESESTITDNMNR